MRPMYAPSVLQTHVVAEQYVLMNVEQSGHVLGVESNRHRHRSIQRSTKSLLTSVVNGRNNTGGGGTLSCR